MNPRRQPMQFQKKIQDGIDEMLKNGVIKECESPWNSPIVCVKKKNSDEIRICLDFRKLNEITERPIFPIPNVDEILDNLGSAQFFSTIDFGNAYYQVELEESSKLKTAFSSRSQQYCFNRMPFGIAAAPATFQRLMNKVLDDLNWKIAIVYLDDIIVYSRTKEQHIENLKCVFEKIEKSGLKIKLEKCAFLKQEVKFLGHVLTKEGLSTDPEKTKAIMEMEAPKCVKQLRSFLGLCNYYRRFIKNYSFLSGPLEKLCSSTNKNLEWNKDCDEKFNFLKQKLMTTPILAFPDYQKSFILDTDASYDCIGAVLSQLNEEGKEQVVSYGSHSLNKHELGYCVTRKELLAIYYFVNNFKHYLYGKKFVVRTDHKAITFMIKTKKPLTAQFQNWIGFLSGLDIEFVYRKGSRKNCTNCNQCQTCHENAKTSKLKTKVLSAMCDNRNKWQRDNKEIDEIRNSLGDSNSRFFEEDDVIRTMDDKIYIPRTTRRDFILDCHSKLCHAGVQKCTKYIEPNFDMEDFDQIIKEVIRSCEICLKRKTFTGKTKEPPINRNIREPFEVIYADFCGPLRQTKFGRRYIFAIIDATSKYIVLKAVNNQDVATLIKILRDEWILRFGAPKILHTDRGKSFEGRALVGLANECGFKIEYSSPYHHSSNGQIERQFRTIRDAIVTKLREKNSKDWAEYLPEVEFMLNATYHKTLMRSPAEVVFGRKIYRENLREDSKEFNNKPITRRKFEKGQKVFLKKMLSNKDEDRYEGPGIIEDQIHERSYQILMKDGRQLIRNVEWLKPFEEGGC